MACRRAEDGTRRGGALLTEVFMPEKEKLQLLLCWPPCIGSVTSKRAPSLAAAFAPAAWRSSGVAPEAGSLRKSNQRRLS